MRPRTAIQAAAIVLLAAAAQAHVHTMPGGRVADAGWIEKNHSDCCGEDDCFPIPRTDLELVKRGWGYGWQVRGHPNTIPEGDVIPSQDGQYWKCVMPDWDGTGPHVRCLFMPGAGV